MLSLHCPLTEATRGLVSRERLARMKPDAVLINTARGALVDTAALAEALKAGRLGGAGIDVLEREPPPPIIRCSLPSSRTSSSRRTSPGPRASPASAASTNSRSTSESFLSGGRRNRVD